MTHPIHSSFKKWKVGDHVITRLLELDPLTLDPAWLLKITMEEVAAQKWLQPCYATEDGHIIANVQAFIIEANGKIILVDPCIGNHKRREAALFHMLDNPFLERMTEAGFPPETIDVVLCTHLHVDHCGWNTKLVDGKWVPSFPNAEYLFETIEYEFTRNEKGPEQEATYRDSIKPIVDAGLATIVSFDHHITDGVRLHPSPGHTPGHCCIVVSSRGEEAVITGDMMHHPVQVSLPDVCSNYCWDEDQAIATRRRLLERCAGTPTLLLGTHFPEPTGVHVVSHGDSWRVTDA